MAESNTQKVSVNILKSPSNNILHFSEPAQVISGSDLVNILSANTIAVSVEYLLCDASNDIVGKALFSDYANKFDATAFAIAISKGQKFRDAFVVEFLKSNANKKRFSMVFSAFEKNYSYECPFSSCVLFSEDCGSFKQETSETNTFKYYDFTGGGPQKTQTGYNSKENCF